MSKTTKRSMLLCKSGSNPTASSTGVRVQAEAPILPRISRASVESSIAAESAVNLWPFGSPDAGTESRARAPFEQTQLSAHVALASSAGDPQARVLVGRMGSGKTRFLLELRDDLEKQGTCELVPPESDLPSLTLVTALAEQLATNPVERAETWRRIWECAIVQSALSRISPGESSIARSIYGEFGQIVKRHPTVAEIRRHLADAQWVEKRQRLEERLAERDKPLCFFLDAVEENSSHSPLYWLWCQKGLVKLVLDWASNPRLADKLWIFVAIREQAWAELKKTTPPALLVQHPNVRVLKWNAAQIAGFLAAKVERLTDHYLLTDAMNGGESEGAQAAVTAWLGTAEVENRERAMHEPVAQYMLRHTRLIPRDVVTMGNLLAEQTAGARLRGERRLSDDLIRDAVAESARLSAAEELQWCGLEIISRKLALSPSAKARRKVLSDEDAGFGSAERLRNLLRDCKVDVITRARLARLDQDARTAFDADVDFGTLLWRHGLLGWGPRRGPFAFSFDPTGDAPPPTATHVAMHPILIDALGIRAAVKGVAVVPFAAGEVT